MMDDRHAMTRKKFTKYTLLNENSLSNLPRFPKALQVIHFYTGKMIKNN